MRLDVHCDPYETNRNLIRLYGTVYRTVYNSFDHQQIHRFEGFLAQTCIGVHASKGVMVSL